MTENSETIHKVTTLPTPKQKKLHNPFTKKTAANAETNETAPKKAPLHSLYVLGALLVVGGVVGSAASKLRRNTDDVEVTETTVTTDPID